MKKQIISIITSLAVLISMLSISVTAANKDTPDSTEQRGDFIYLKDTNEIIAYVGESEICEPPENTEISSLNHRSFNSTPVKKLIVGKNVNVPPSYKVINDLQDLKEVEIKEGVTEVPYQFLYGCLNLESVSLPSTIVKIDDYALADCPKLKSIELPDGLQSIGKDAFRGDTALSGDLFIPDTVTYMSPSAFTNCGKFDTVHLSDSIVCDKKEQNWWFTGTEIKAINIPDTMLDCGNCYFHGDEITFNSDMTVKIYNAVAGSQWCMFKYLKGKTDKSMGNYDGFAVVQNTVLRYVGTDKNPVVPDGIKAINASAFRYCDIDTVTLPSSLETIGEAAFHMSTIKSVVIPKNVKKIGDNAFAWCPLLEEVTFEGEPQIGSKSFEISDKLTEDNLIFKTPALELKNKIISFGIVENDLTSFYELLNENRRRVGFEEIDAVITPKPTATPDETPVPTAAPEGTPVPTTTPEGTPAPSVEPKTLYIKGGETITIKVDEKTVDFPDAKPFVDDNGRTQVPVRAVSEMLDCKVDWVQETQTAVIEKENGELITLTLGSDIMTIGESQVKMDTTVLLKEERTYIPVRFVAEALGLTVEWVE